MRSKTGWTTALCLLGALTVRSAVYDAEVILQRQGLSKAGAAARTAAVQQLVGQLKSGDVLGLPRTSPLGRLDFTAAPSNIQIEYGSAEEIDLGAGKDNVVLLGVDAFVRGADLSNCFTTGIGGLDVRNEVNGTHIGIGGSLAKSNRAMMTLTGCIQGGTYFDIRYYDYGVSSDNLSSMLISINLDGCDNKNTVVYQIVEHNYCESLVQVFLRGCNGLTYGPGDTERQRPSSACYLLADNIDVTLFGHRTFSGKRSECSNATTGVSTKVLSGAARFVYSYDIGMPRTTSLDASGADGLELWGAWFEDAVLEGSNAFRMLTTEQGMTTVHDAWTEPTLIEGEYIVKTAGYAIKGTDTDAADKPNVTIPEPPMIPSPEIRGFPAGRLAKHSAAWGAKLLAAGADPSGRRSSTAAFKKLFASEEVVEVPCGTFLLDEPLVMDDQTIVRQLLGAGDDCTILKGLHDGAIIDIRGTGMTKRTQSQGVIFDGIGFTNAAIGIRVQCYKGLGCLTPDGTISGCTFDGLDSAGVWWVREKPSHEFDQVRMRDNVFRNIGLWGIRLDGGMIDKEAFIKMRFENIGKAGIFCPGTYMFAGTIYECVFENIGGPGVDFYPVWNYSPAYPPHCSMINRCRFINCGSSDRAALDWGFVENGGVVDCKVVIDDGRAIKYGIAGTGPYFDRCTVQVDNGTITHASFAFRNGRRVYNARPAGSIVRRCAANTKAMRFVYDDVPDVDSTYGHLQLKQTDPGNEHFTGMKWWQAEDPSTIYPWAYAHLIFESKFADQDIGYILFRNNVNGQNLQQVCFKGEPIAVPSVGATVHPLQGTGKGAVQWVVYDVRGRRVAAGRDERLPVGRRDGRIGGVHVVKSVAIDGKESKAQLRLGSGMGH